MEALQALGINGLFLLSQIVNFLILFVALRVLLWKPLLQQLDARREVLQRQQEDAEAVAQTRAEIDQERARVLEESRAEASRLLAEAREQGRELTDQATSEARKQAEQRLAQARQEAEDERDRILEQTRDDVAALAIAAAHKLIGEALDERRQRALVSDFFSGIREGRVEVLPEKLDAAEGPVVVTSAIPLTDEERGTVGRDLASRLGEGVEVSFRVDPQILGGLTIRVGGRVIDGSMAGQLQQLRRTLA